jgi:hypothetical protein
VAAVLVVA